MENLGDFASAVRDLGVPIVVLGWFMWRMEKRIDKMQDTLTTIATLLKDSGR